MPRWFKQTLTTLQITQFVVGTVYAFLHLFVAYQIPVSVPYLYRLGDAASKVVSDVPAVTSSIATAISTAADMKAWLKKLALRGAGYEGLAENVVNNYGEPFGVDAAHIVQDAIRREETRYKDELQWVNCLDTSGQVFAILLNCIYLLPLTWLFVQFFFTAYFHQTERRKSRTASDAAIAARKSFYDATKGVSRQLSDAVGEMHNVSEDIGDDDAVFVDGAEIKREMQEEAEKIMDSLKQGREKVKQKINDSGISTEAVKQEFQRDMEAARKTLNDSAEKVKNAAANATDPETREKLVAKAQAMKDSAAEAVEAAMENIKATASKVKEQAQPTVDSAAQKAADLKEQAGPKAQAAADKAGELKDRGVEAAQNAASQAKESAPKVVEDAKVTAQTAGDKVKAAAQTASDQAQKKGKEISDKAKETAQPAVDQAQKKGKEASNKAKETAQQAKENAQQGKDTAKATAESSKPKAEETSKDIEKKSDKTAKSPTKKQQSEAGKSTSQSSSPTKKKSPNGDGTSGRRGIRAESQPERDQVNRGQIDGE